MAVPGLAVATGIEEAVPVGVQFVSARFHEDIRFDAGAVIKAASPSFDSPLTCKGWVRERPARGLKCGANVQSHRFVMRARHDLQACGQSLR